MIHLRHWRPLLALLLLAGGLRVSPLAAQGGEIFRLVNAFRAENGLSPFQQNNALTAAAQNQANYMAANMVFSSHVGAGGSTPQSRAEAAGYVGYVSENIVGGTNMSPRQGLIWWQNSPVHFNTLVTSRYIEAGAAHATNGSENFYVLVVGRPSDAPPTGAPDASPDPLFITPIALAEPREDGSIVHVVQEGQALWSLAAHYEVNLADLLLYNNLAPDSFIQPGDEVIIRLAEGQEPPPTPTPPLTHVVQEGQTPWTIAALYGLSLSEFLWLNGLTEDDFLHPGEEVVVRLAAGQPPPPTPTPILFHSIRSGQTLWNIALTYGLTLEQLLAFNDLTETAVLQVGQQIRVRPFPSPTPTVTPAPTQTSTPSGTAAPPTVTAPPATVTPATLAALPSATVPPVETAVAADPISPLTVGTAVFGLGLLALAIAAVAAVRKER